MGKTTTIRTILGLLPATAGSIRFAVGHRQPPRIARAGQPVPETPGLPEPDRARTWSHRAAGQRLTLRASDLFAPAERAGNRQRTVGRRAADAAIGRALMTNPRLLILDEATEGLAPLIRREIWASLARLRAAGLAILVVDKDVAALSRLCDRHVILERGRVVWSGSASDLLASPDLAHRRLGHGTE
jgi:branched-chain amino acid transport system ATP-binding protein